MKTPAEEIPPEIVQMMSVLLQKELDTKTAALLQEVVATVGIPPEEAHTLCITHQAMSSAPAVVCLPLEISGCVYAVICKPVLPSGWEIVMLKPWPTGCPTGTNAFVALPNEDGAEPAAACGLVNTGPADNPTLAVALSLVQRD